MIRTAPSLAALAVMLSACTSSPPEQEERAQRTVDATEQARGSATEPAGEVEAGANVVDTLAGAWRVAGIDGEPFDEPYGLALTGNETRLWWEPDCARQIRTYRIDGTAIDFASPDAPAPAAEGVPRRPICTIGLPERLNDVFAALDAATRIERTPQNGILVSGGGRSLTLFSQWRSGWAIGPRMTVTRFAPSPTGRLHVGNIRTALHNWMLARASGGRFLLRIDDTDAERSREEFVEAIRADLAWLGLEPDGEVRQSQRLDLYDAAFERLREAGRVYPAYETAQELELKRKIQLGRGLPPIYDRASLALSAQERAAKEAEGIAPHWRFRLDHDASIAWNDGVRGPQKFDPAQLSDPVVRRADGSWLYMLPTAVDDIALGVTDVLRGEDHVSNTAVQIQMFTALVAAGFGGDAGAAEPHPSFAHEALLVGSEGKLSKRLGSLGCDSFRERGIEPEALVAMLARLGTSQPVEPIADRARLVEGFDLSTFGRAPAKFDDAELERINAAIVHQLAFEAVAGRLPDGMDEAGWHAIRPNLAHVGEAGEWWRLVTGPIAQPDFDPADRAFLAEAARLLEWGADPWRGLTAALKEATGRKGKPLFLPLRQALTGMDHGPDMAELLPLIGEERARARLQDAVG